ncbi:pentapeptide repeat-containing protein [Actinomadura flavalba]|uniref:pentapeptide repeat-containing protein n=1 Tax=Actinomadura flavalba TaxID=1120938 RepID=UPI0003745580|nr:pentapeptide repeat-containing protein [Actinomadura flavalba]
MTVLPGSIRHRCAVPGCTGRPAACLLDPPAGLRPGDDLDLRGLTVPDAALAALLDALTDAAGTPRVGRARFDGAVLPPGAALRGVRFEGDASFDGARFTGAASFYGASFLGHVSFHRARFAGNASFHGAHFHRHAAFTETVFAGDVLFGDTRWHADAVFDSADVTGAAAFDAARFGRDVTLRAARFAGPVSFRHVEAGRHARLDRARFRQGLRLGPLTARGSLVLTGLTALGDLHVRATAPVVTAREAAVRGAGGFRLRDGALDLEGAAFGAPLTVCGEAAAVLSLRDVSAPHVTLTGLDLTHCRFLGLSAAVALDGCAFATARHRPAARARAVLAEDVGGAADPRLTGVYTRLAASAPGALGRDLRHGAARCRHRARPRRARLLRWLTLAL